MAKKFLIESELKKARELLAKDSSLGEVLKQVIEASKVHGTKSVKTDRLRLPYGGATPLHSVSWK